VALLDNEHGLGGGVGRLSAATDLDGDSEGLGGDGAATTKLVPEVHELSDSSSTCVRFAPMYPMCVYRPIAYKYARLELDVSPARAPLKDDCP